MSEPLKADELAALGEMVRTGRVIMVDVNADMRDCNVRNGLERLLATIDARDAEIAKLNSPTGRFLDGLRWRDARVKILDGALRELLDEILLRMEGRSTGTERLGQVLKSATNALLLANSEEPPKP